PRASVRPPRSAAARGGKNRGAPRLCRGAPKVWGCGGHVGAPTKTIGPCRGPPALQAALVDVVVVAASHRHDGEDHDEQQRGGDQGLHTAPPQGIGSKAGATDGGRGPGGTPRMSTWETLPAQFNVATWFVDRNVAEGRGASPAFHCEDRTLTYTDVQDLTNRTGNALLDLGVRMEDRVLLLCLDAPEFLGAFWGAIKIGAIPIPVNTLMRADDYLYFLQDSRAKAAVISAPLLAEAGPVLGQASHLRHVLVAGGKPGAHLSYEDRVARGAAA